MGSPKDPMSHSEYEAGGLFTASRNKPFPSIFPSHRTAVTYDVLYVGMLVAFLVILVSFLAIFPTVTGLKEKMKVLMRVICCLTLGTAIMACNFGQEWEVGVIRTKTPYKIGTGQEIKAQIGIHLGLRSVNITLKALEEPHGDLSGERIDYNERFGWTWGQGNPGFGPHAGSLQRAFRRAQEKGLPLPILWVAEYFVIDGEGIRFGRHYRYSGWYAHICIWTAFPLWIVTTILFKMVIRMAAQALILTGVSLASASIIWAFNRNFTELYIPFEDDILTTTFGIHWYLSLIMGSLCIIVGVAIYVFDSKYPESLSSVFGNDPLRIVEQETRVEEEVKVEEKDTTRQDTIRKKTLKTAGRRVVTTLRVFGTKKTLKKVTHGSLDPSWSTSTSSSVETRYMMPEDEPIQPSTSTISISQAFPQSGKHSAVSHRQSQDDDNDMSSSQHQSETYINTSYKESDEETEQSFRLLQNP